MTNARSPFQEFEAAIAAVERTDERTLRLGLMVPETRRSVEELQAVLRELGTFLRRAARAEKRITRALAATKGSIRA